MTKEELLLWLNEWRDFYHYAHKIDHSCPDKDGKDICFSAYKELLSLIENFGGTEEEVWGKKEYDFSGGERGPIDSSGVRVGDEEREELINHLRAEGFYRLSFCPKCDRIIALIRQEKRTVSRDSALAWWKGIHKMGIKSGGKQFLTYLRSLGIEVKE